MKRLLLIFRSSKLNSVYIRHLVTYFCYKSISSYFPLFSLNLCPRKIKMNLVTGFDITGLIMEEAKDE